MTSLQANWRGRRYHSVIGYGWIFPESNIGGNDGFPEIEIPVVLNYRRHDFLQSIRFVERYINLFNQTTLMPYYYDYDLQFALELIMYLQNLFLLVGR